MLVKTVKISKEEPAEPLSPLVLGELFQWDGRALAITLFALVIVLVLLAGLFFRKDYEMFLFLTVLNTLLPTVLLALRTTTGRLREFFLSMLVAILLLIVGFPIGGLTVGFTSIRDLLMFAPIPIGIAAGCALIYFGKVRPKVR